MPKPYSDDLRARVVEEIEQGATREEAAERFGVSLSSVGRFLRLERETGSISPAKFGGYKRYALAAHEEWVRKIGGAAAGHYFGGVAGSAGEGKDRDWPNVDLSISASSATNL